MLTDKVGDTSAEALHRLSVPPEMENRPHCQKGKYRRKWKILGASPPRTLHHTCTHTHGMVMVASTFDIFKIGVGPSSSHTMGPMLAAADFANQVGDDTARVEVLLYGSLTLTGKGHETDRAIMLGPVGQRLATIDPAAEQLIEQFCARCSSA